MENSRAKDALVIGDDSEIEEGAYQEDYDNFWDSVYEATGALVKERDDKNDRYKRGGNIGGWLVEGSGMGWRGQRGHKFIDVKTYERKDRAIGFDFLNQILPQTDNTFYIYDLENGNGLLILNNHHDAPVNSERYECLPLDYMIDQGLWWGINSSEGDIIEEIWEQVQYEWEQFLNDKLAARNDEGEKIGGMMEALDIEGMPLLTEFLARYKLKPEGQAELLVVRDDLLGFFDDHYATSTDEAWVDYLHNEADMQDYDGDLDEFLGSYGIVTSAVSEGDLQRMKGTYDMLLREKRM